MPTTETYTEKYPTHSSRLTARDVLQQVQDVQDGLLAQLLSPATRFADVIPAFSGNILELHFNGHNTFIDFATRINKLYDKALIAALNYSDYALPLMPADLFNYGIENIWIEYDAPFYNMPALFFDINKNLAFNPEKAAASLRDIMLTYGIAENKHLLSYLQKIESIEAYVVYYGLMLSRKTQSLRLTVNGIRPGNLVSSLASLGWKGNYQALQKICTRYLHQDQKIVLGIDVGETLHNRISIEIFDKNIKKFTELLYRQHQLTAEQYGWLDRWEQVRYMPPGLSQALSTQHHRRIRELHTRINHFKFVLNESEDTTLKGYLYYCF